LQYFKFLRKFVAVMNGSPTRFLQNRERIEFTVSAFPLV
jgi:hypothetical protein